MGLAQQAGGWGSVELSRGGNLFSMGGDPSSSYLHRGFLAGRAVSRRSAWGQSRHGLQLALTSRASCDCEAFVGEVLQDEKLSKRAKEMRTILLNNFRVVYNQNPQEFAFKSESRQEDSSDDNQGSSLGRSDDASVASDYQDEASPEWEIVPVAAQDLCNVLKQGYLEKRRRDHSFFGSEWQKRWCVLNNSIFYYFSSEKDKQQNGSFYINGYTAAQVGNLRKDSRKMACFELSAPGQRTYQFTASSPREAREWVDQINFVLKDLSSSFIPFDEEEEEEEGEEGGGEEAAEEEEGEETYDDIEGIGGGAVPPRPGAALASRGGQGGRSREEGEDDEDDEDAIYEILPDEEFPEPMDEPSESSRKQGSLVDYSNYYQCLWDCEGDQPDELNFHRGDLIHILSKVSIQQQLNVLIDELLHILCGSFEMQ
ncbi:Src kinase-associated phosphoprotein 1 [Merluccius polli]|uniref:Src kinase-associated phosphoprotein 1 n=1 Tax=Merluccius polli TaxID=89951 RepID=A0AA47MC89_MERPO|nr:Src kinase-associated phosphoprotein 1 [Merluccius polli]